ncbi:hypothetical protein KQH49_13755 [Mycetohabitans sp. B5]|jgi:hypothetical protein|uniref:hypothetical protein n=1 Tax=Mycetohabitans TaxID=2571159 RepID=UPI0013047FEF|nr:MULTISPECIES: hypothetical protein [Mycetohabitans]MCG1055935.1 hypothetical protein [Mycetohabitans sp. B5]
MFIACLYLREVPWKLRDGPRERSAKCSIEAQMRRQGCDHYPGADDAVRQRVHQKVH